MITDKFEKEMIQALRNIIAINSVKQKKTDSYPFGEGAGHALEYMLLEAENMGFKTQNLDNYAGCVVYGPENEKLAILAHLDVVPEGEGWDTDPFELTEKYGKLFGRGTIDNKGPAVASLFALKAVKDSGIALKCGVRIIFGCDEESGWDDIEYYKRNMPEPEMVITPDGSFPVVNAEKGLLHILLSKKIVDNLCIKSLAAGTRPNIVPNKAVAVFNRQIKADIPDCPAKFEISENVMTVIGKAAHGSQPQDGVNAAAYMLEALAEILPDGDIKEFARVMTEKIDIKGEKLGIAVSDEETGNLSLNLGTLELCEGEIQAKIDIRYPVSVNYKDLLEKIREQFAPHGITAEPIHQMDGHIVSADSELVTVLQSVYEDCFNKPAELLCSAGATYARAFKNGVAFGPVEKDATSTEHGPNEYIEKQALLELANALACAIIRLCA